MSNELVQAIHDLPLEEQLETLEALLGGLTIGTVVKLVPRLEEAWDVKVRPDFSGTPPVEEEKEQTEFSVLITEMGPKRLTVVKAVRSVTQLDLKKSKGLLKGLLDEGLPALIREKISRDEAEAAKSKLEESGATVEIK